MRDINCKEILSISGGVSYLVATSHLRFDGCSVPCVASYLKAHQSDVNIVGLTLSEFYSKIPWECYYNNGRGYTEMEDVLISLKLPA